ncbi:MAG: C39 family peptidase [Nitrospiraceae bacterium]
MLRRWLNFSMTLLLGGCVGIAASDRDSSPLLARHTLKELRDQHVVKQELDYSCGAAALATLMVYYYGEPTSEKEILSLLERRLTEKERALKAERGFSLLDLKRVAQTKGYQAAGFKLTAEQLTKLAAPVIVFVEPQGYKHFAVLRGMNGGRVYLADPARGNLRMGIDRFLGEWGGIVFVLGKRGEETIRTYPLLPPQPPYVQPELLGVIDLQDEAAYMRNLPLR